MSNLDIELDVKKEIKTKDGDQLFNQEESFKALMGDDEDTVAFVFQHVNPDQDGILARVARTTRGLLSFGAVVQGEVERDVDKTGKGDDKPPSGVTSKAFRHWKPSITVEKSEITVNEGDQAMLQVQINGYPKPDIRCTFEDIAITPNKKYKIYHENEEHLLMLVIKDTHFSDSGTYTIMAENEIGFDSVEIKLNVVRLKYPEIKTAIDDLSISVHENILFTLEVDGIPKPDVVFLKDGRHIPYDERIKCEENYPFYTLSMQDLTLNDTGIYSLVATNIVTQASEFWSIYVYSKPTFLQNLGSNLQIDQHETIKIRAKIVAEPQASIFWFKDDQQVIPSKRLIIDDEDGYFILKIKDTVIQDAGNYTFKAENAYGVIEDSLRIDVRKAPTIIKSFEDATVLEQDVYHIIHTVAFDIELEVFPKPEVKWYLDGDELLPNVKELTRIETDNTVKLIVNEPTTDLSGTYLCKITNQCGQAIASGKLTVNCSPRIIVDLNDQTIDEAMTLYLEVVVRGHPTPTFKWFRNHQEIDADERIAIGLETYGKHKYKLTCIIYEISYAERGEYWVEVSNDFGEAKGRCFVNVQTRPVILHANMTDMCIKEGDDVTYTIVAFSNPPPIARWTWEGEIIDTEDPKDINKLITSHDREFRLGIRKAKMVDAGTYQITVTNCVGTTKHRAALAVVRRRRDRSP